MTEKESDCSNCPYCAAERHTRCYKFTCKACGMDAIVGHTNWCSITCQSCNATMPNPAHKCKGMNECHYNYKKSDFKKYMVNRIDWE